MEIKKKERKKEKKKIRKEIKFPGLLHGHLHADNQDSHKRKGDRQQGKESKRYINLLQLFLGTEI